MSQQYDVKNYLIRKLKTVAIFLQDMYLEICSKSIDFADTLFV